LQGTIDKGVFVYEIGTIVMSTRLAYICTILGSGFSY